MANKFKYNKTGAEANSIFKGNWAIDNTPVNSGGGPSSVTSFYHGANQPEDIQYTTTVRFLQQQAILNYLVKLLN